jgi:glycerate 2-kinase
MNILIAPDKFKDGATAFEICQALKRGILQTFPEAICTLRPLADGGEGTLESIADSFEAVWQTCEVTDPLFRTITAQYLLIPTKKMAIIEMARASGIELLTQNERNCLITSSLGCGMLIVDALKKGAKEIILTVGGTATNDAGMGIANALGFEFYDKNNEKLSPIGQNLIKIHQIKRAKNLFDISAIKFTIATDVQNPFYGKNGASHIFAKQKGATETGILALDDGLKNMANLLQNLTGANPQDIVGSGAGGGVGGGLACLLNAKIISAADWILALNDISELLVTQQVIITGEGKVDNQTWNGKLIAQILNMATKAQVPVIVVCGTLSDVDLLTQQNNIIYACSILSKPMPLTEALTQTKELVEQQGMLLGKLLPKLTIKNHNYTTHSYHLKS